MSSEFLINPGRKKKEEFNHFSAMEPRKSRRRGNHGKKKEEGRI
jgi:hypothetical protein